MAPHGYAPAASKARPGKPYPLLGLTDVADENFILTPRDHSTRRLIDIVQARTGVTLKRYKESERQEAALRLVAFGEGLAFTLDSYLPYCHLPRPVDLYQLEGAPQTGFSLISRKGVLEASTAETLKDIVREAFVKAAQENE